MLKQFVVGEHFFGIMKMGWLKTFQLQILKRLVFLKWIVPEGEKIYPGKTPAGKNSAGKKYCPVQLGGEKCIEMYRQEWSARDFRRYLTKIGVFVWVKLKILKKPKNWNFSRGTILAEVFFSLLGIPIFFLIKGPFINGLGKTLGTRRSWRGFSNLPYLLYIPSLKGLKMLAKHPVATHPVWAHASHGHDKINVEKYTGCLEPAK